jgi:hypothetical protein
MPWNCGDSLPIFFESADRALYRDLLAEAATVTIVGGEGGAARAFWPGSRGCASSARSARSRYRGPTTERNRANVAELCPSCT